CSMTDREKLADWLEDKLSYEREAAIPTGSPRAADPIPYFKSDFDCVPVGDLIQPNKFRVFSTAQLTQLYDADAAGDFFKCVAGGGPNGENCQEHSYSEGSYGMGTQYYQLQLGPCCEARDPINVEWDWLFLDGTDIVDDASGKIAPAIQVGKISGPDSGTRMMTWFSAQGSNAKAPKFTANLQDQRSGNQWVPGGQNYSPFNIELGRWYHLRMQFLPGPEGFARWWIGGEEWKCCGPTINNYLTDSITIDVTTFYGGGAANAPKNATSKSRLANLEVYSGFENRGPAPKPEPVELGFVVKLADVSYRLTGTGTLVPVHVGRARR